MSNLDASVASVLRAVRALLTDRTYFWYTAALVIIGDAILTQLIIRFIPYTEIDWETYMIQVKLFMKGERDYSLIAGPTGPLVYPAGHVYVYWLLHAVTDGGRNLRHAQHIFSALYTISQVLTCYIYYHAENVPNWIICLLPLSKRLHSIYVLRLFNDCWASVAAQGAVVALQLGYKATAVVLFSAALSIKMSVLLYLPALLVILVKRHGVLGCLHCLFMIGASQALIAWPFISKYPHQYLHNAFDFSRVFMYKWTVNWRFFSEENFLSPELSKALVLAHVSTLIAFGACKWCQQDGGVTAILSRAIRRPTLPVALASLTADHVATLMLTSNLIGLLFARSLHYQFYSWYAQQLPFLAWRTKYPVILKLALLLAIEYAWNVYPSTSLSSSVLFSAHILMLMGIWTGYPEGKTVHRLHPRHGHDRKTS